MINHPVLTFIIGNKLGIMTRSCYVASAVKQNIEGTIKQRLPDDFQLAEFQLEKGFVDMIAERKKMRSVLSHLMILNNYRPEEI